MQESQSLKNKKLALFFTYGVSLDLWEKKGMFDRELKIYKKLGEKFEKIYFFTYGSDDGRFQKDLSKYNIEVLPKKSWLPNFLYSLFNILYYKKELKSCNFFKTNQMLGSWSAVLAKKFFKKKLIVRTGYTLSIFSKRVSRVKYILSKIIEWFALKNCDTFVVATESEKKYFSKYKDKTRIIPNYVDTELFKPMPELKNKEEKTVLLFVGRLNLQKNLRNLLKAFGGLKDVRLQIIGSGELKDELVGLAKEKKLDVEFLDNKPHEELPRFMNFADIFILPSLYEGNPKLLLEAMACGLPILTTNVDGIKNIISHKENGVLVGTKEENLRHGVKLLLEKDNNHSVLGLRARELIVRNYSIKKVVSKELKNYV